ncbi:MAG TPA: TetR/AcrR family transcriptional regulator [Pseudonocardia sp.]|jgi:AcrR family transcriptional regulator
MAGAEDGTVGGPPGSGTPARRPRRDAERNRRLLVQAAIETFRDEGLDVALDAIARRAGVGNATLYRHFPTREDLYEAVFAGVQERLTEVLARYESVLDGRAALRAFIVEIFTISPASSALGRLADERLDVSPVLMEIVEEVRGTLRRLLTLAQEQGTVRPDVNHEDLELLLATLRPIMVASIEVAPSLGRRHLTLLLDALRPEARTMLPPPEATREQRDRLGRAARNA